MSRYHKYMYNYDRWIKRTGWDPFKYEKQDILPSLDYKNQTFGALNKCWLGFTIAKNKDEYDKIEMYALRIQKLEKQSGREITDFSNRGIIYKTPHYQY